MTIWQAGTMNKIDESQKPTWEKMQADAESRKASKDGSTSTLGGGGSTFDGMDHELNTRVSRLEGGNSTLQWSVAAISSVLIGALAIVVGLQVYTLGQVSSLSAKVDALPGEISSDIQELTRTLSGSITAAREMNPAPAPQIIYVEPRREEPQANVPPN